MVLRSNARVDVGMVLRSRGLLDLVTLIELNWNLCSDIMAA